MDWYKTESVEKPIRFTLKPNIPVIPFLPQYAVLFAATHACLGGQSHPTPKQRKKPLCSGFSL